MVSLVTRERESGSLSLPMPLTGPSVQAAMEFLQWVVPPTVFSAGSGRRRRRGESPRSEGQRSDQGYLLFYSRPDEARAPRIRPLKALTSIEAYFQEQAAGELAEHWVATQITQYRAGRDGVSLTGGFGAGDARHILGMVADLDGKRMDPMYLRLLKEDWWGFFEVLDARMAALGIERYLVVRSGPDGVHIYIPLIRPDGRPLRATEKNLAAWERAAKGLHRHLVELGADANAVKPVQPFAIPGIPRAKHGGFVPYVAARQAGRVADLFRLIRRMSELRLMPRTQPAPVLPLPLPDLQADVSTILNEIRTLAAGLAEHEGRNQAAHDIAVYLLCKGATEQEMTDALVAWNARNAPPLSHRELLRCIRSALRRAAKQDRQWAEMKKAPWLRLRALLSLSALRMAGYTRGGRFRPLTPRKDWEDRKMNGGREHYEEVAERLLRFVAGEGGRVEMIRAEICDRIDTNPSTLRDVLDRLEASGQLLVTTRRGRNGNTILELPHSVARASSDKVTENNQSRISPEGVETGAWVGSCRFAVGALSCEGVDGAADDPVTVLCEVVLADLDLDLYAYVPSPIVAVLDPAGGGWLLYPRGPVGQGLLRVVAAAGLVAEVSRRLGGVPVQVGPPGHRG